MIFEVIYFETKLWSLVYYFHFNLSGKK